MGNRKKVKGIKKKVQLTPQMIELFELNDQIDNVFAKQQKAPQEK